MRGLFFALSGPEKGVLKEVYASFPIYILLTVAAAAAAVEADDHERVAELLSSLVPKPGTSRLDVGTANAQRRLMQLRWLVSGLEVL